MTLPKPLTALFLTLSLLATPGTGGCAPPTRLSLSANERLAEQWVAARVMSGIYAQAGLRLQVQAMPAARATAAITTGQTDGEVARIYSYGQHHAQLIRVEPAYYRLSSMAFWQRNAGFSIERPSDLAGHSVGVIRGVVHSSDLMAGHRKLTQTQSAEQMFRMLAAGRFEVAINTEVNGHYLVRRLGLTGLQSSPELVQQPLYHYLHPSQRALAPLLSQTIARLKASGELDQLIARAEAELQLIDIESFSGPIP